MTQFQTRLTVAAALMLGAAMPAFAQEGLCGGVGDAGQWLGGDEATSDIATSGAFMEQMALVLMNNEYVANFTLSTAMDVRLEAEGRGAGDPVMDIRDAAGTIVASDDDSGGNSASRLETYLEAGTYCISMRSYDGAPMTGFVRVGLLEHEALTDGLMAITDEPFIDEGYIDPTCDLSRATDLGYGMSIDSVLYEGGAIGEGSVNDYPYWSFTLDSPTALTITAENESADPIVTLFDPYGYYLAENDDYNGLNSQLDMTYPLEPGTYCISMTALNDTSLPILVTVAGYDPALAMIGMYERGEASPPMDGSYPVEALGTLERRLRKDIQTTSTTTWYSLDVPEGGLLLIEAITNGMGDPTLVLFDDFGRQVAYNDDNGEGLDSRITARVLPGLYMVGVRQLSDGPQVLTRMLFERYVPAQ